ncbi:unnamed protein product [Urochloa decumbens]|uniref:Protein MIZU-KUSSEI 1 n=1 Tax=Urochloa decumbens TaxID=240449 RepID=A0ABC9E8W2_9POAL
MAARAFHAAASPAPGAVPASPLPSSKNTTTGLANLQWLLRKRRPNKVQHGRPAFFDRHHQDPAAEADDDDECASMFAGATPYVAPGAGAAGGLDTPPGSTATRRGGGSGEALSRLRSAILSVLARARLGRGGRRGMGSSVTGTIFGRRRGRVHLALQTDPRAPPALLVELAAYSTGALVREMASGLVRLALECEKDKAPPPPPTPQQQTAGSHHHHNQRRHHQTALVEEATWRAYCNGRKCGYAVRRECGAEEWRVLRAVEPVSVGAGVLPDGDGTGVAAGGGEGDMMYMRAKFERVVGSRDSEAFYMVNPDGGGGPELSIYLLRV